MPRWGCGYSHHPQLVSFLFLHISAAILHRNLSHHGGSFHPNPQATAAALPCLQVACYKPAPEKLVIRQLRRVMASGDSHVVVILGERHGLRYPVASLLMKPGAIDVHAHHQFLWHATLASKILCPLPGSSNLHHLTLPTPLSWTIMCKSPTYFGVFRILKA